MNRFLPFFFLTSICLIFFYQSVFFGKVPFPGDMLIAQYVPWKYESFLGFNPGSYPHKAQYFDVLQQLYPWRTFAVSQIQAGNFSLWNPYNFSGMPLFANIQSAVLNPANIFFLLFPSPLAWTITVLLQCLLASIFLYLFARRLSLSVFPSLFSAIAYSYSLFMTVFLEYNTIGYVLALLPAVFYLLELCFQKRTFFRTIFLTVFLALLFLVGHLQLAVVGFVFALVYGVFRGTYALREQKRNIIFIIVPFLLSLVLSSIQLFPAGELLTLSARVPQEYAFLVSKLLIQPWQLIMLIIPDIFGNPVTRNFLPNETYPTKALSVGVATLLFALISLRQWKKASNVSFFALSAGVVSLFVTLNPFSSLFYRLNIPLFSTSSPSNMIFLLAFCLSILSGYGMQFWIEKQGLKKITIVFLGIIILFTILSFSHRAFMQEKNILFSSVFIVTSVMFYLVGSYRPQWKTYVAILFIALVSFELFFFFQKFNPFVSPELMYPETAIVGKLRSLTVSGERVWSFGNAALEPNVQTSLRLYSPEGYDPLYPSYYGQLIASSRDGVLPTGFDRLTRSNAQIAPQANGETSLSLNDYRLRILDILSVKYILDRVENASSEKTFPIERFKQAYNKNGWVIYENTKARPRAWLSASYVVTKTLKDFETTFFNPSFPYNNKVTLSEDSSKTLTLKQGDVSQFIDQPDKQLYKTTTDGDGLLVLAQTYYPGWQVFIDGEKSKLFRVNHALSGVFVPEGEHVVALYYWPQSFVFGLATTIIGIAALLLYSFVVRSK
ncbi:MAG: YfhO family protein [Candidatus Levybacteria bacterium]|nr:YfhO family protein [Candidatus Levybacteria bacterium]